METKKQTIFSIQVDWFEKWHGSSDDSTAGGYPACCYTSKSKALERLIDVIEQIKKEIEETCEENLIPFATKNIFVNNQIATTNLVTVFYEHKDVLLKYYISIREVDLIS